METNCKIRPMKIINTENIRYKINIVKLIKISYYGGINGYKN